MCQILNHEIDAFNNYPPLYENLRRRALEIAFSFVSAVEIQGFEAFDVKDLRFDNFDLVTPEFKIRVEQIDGKVRIKNNDPNTLFLPLRRPPRKPK